MLVAALSRSVYLLAHVTRLLLRFPLNAQGRIDGKKIMGQRRESGLERAENQQERFPADKVDERVNET